MSHHFCSVSGVRRSPLYRTIARLAIGAQVLTLVPAGAVTASASQAPVASIASFASAAAPRAAREADEQLAALRLPPGAVLSDDVPAPASEVPPPPDTARPSFMSVAPSDDEGIETLLADYLLGAEQRPTPVSGARSDGPTKPTPIPAPKPVVVNRTVPRVTPRPTEPTLSAEPVDREFFDARIFAEPLVPVGATAADDNRSLGQALRAYLNGRNRENVSIVLAHLQRFPASPWRASLLANIGTVFSQHGYYTRAFASWDAAWQLTRADTDPRVRAIADYAMSQWLELMTRFGDVTALEGKMKELEGRQLTGSTGARIKVAREGLWILKNHHDWATPSARTALASWLYVRSPAYARVRARAKMSAEAAAEAERASGSKPLGAAVDWQGAPEFRTPHALADFHAKAEGTSLRELARLAAASGLNVRPAYRPAGASLVTPAIAHLKPGHYAFVVKQEDHRVLLRDSILGGEIWFSRVALEEESSGYWLINDGPLPSEWRAVQDHEANVVIGRCAPGGASDTDPCECPGSPGMPTYYFHPVNASLRLVDTPIGYAPPRGPAAQFTLSYNHREVLQPSTLTYSNFGPMWTYDWLSYVQEMPTVCSPSGICINPYASVFLRGSGEEQYRNPDVNGVYAAFFRSRAVLVKVSDSPVRYERRLPDGGMEVFTQSNGAPSGQRRIFLTSIVDSQGQALQMTYDAQLRLVAFTDAIGQVTTVSYDHPTDPLKITKVTDPFGRFATFTYTTAGQLASITDVIGLTSSFTYANADFISAMTTPYGTTTFRHEIANPYPRMVEATDPLGGTEHLEFHNQNTLVPNTEPAALVPTGFSAFNENLQFFNSFYWSKRQWALHPGDVTKATRTHWLLYDLNLDDGNHGSAGSIPHSVKQPLENRVWYAYPGQGAGSRWVGSAKQPERVGRVLDDGSSQIWQAAFNTLGRRTSEIDPLGRRTSYVYAANGIDLLEERQTTGAVNDLLATYGSYTATHLPQTVTDAAGQTASYTYNAQGQLLTTTTPTRAGITEDRTTTYIYDANGYLQSITAPTATSSATFTHDSHGRVRTKTSHDGYTLTFDYDTFDRTTRMTFPDGTYMETTYSRLDPATERDRMGRLTRTVYDALRRPVAVRDASGGVTTFTWCTCGSLDKLVDANGQVTSWERDVQNRVTRVVRADGSDVTFTYRATDSRVAHLRDAKLQVATIEYFADDSWKQASFSNTTHATPTVSYTYDPVYNRLATMTDGTGTTTYAYYPVTGAPSPGAGLLQSVDGPLANDVITYSYDELGRIVGRSINGTALTQTFDALARVNSETNVLGTFTYGYDGFSSRLTSVSYPNGQSTTLGYLGNALDRRLADIHNKRPGGTTLSRFQYSYAADGAIATWRQQVDSIAATQFDLGRDGENRLLAATLRTVDATPVTLKRYGYSYDRAGNRVGEQLDDSTSKAAINNLNQVTSRQAGGALRFAGALSEAATVTVQGKAAVVTPANEFSGVASVPSGTSTVNVSATDTSGNTQSKTYEVTQSGTPATLAYDANGSLVSDGTRVFEWDGSNRLTAVEQGTHRTEFTYNGWGRRVRIVEKDSGVITSDVRLLWCGQALCEERDSTGASVTRRYFDHGMQEGSAAFFYARDHLDSIRELTDSTGAVRARYDYDPYGRTTKMSGDLESPQTFTGHFAHGPSGLLLAPYRAYDPGLGRWINPDPLGFGAGANFYAYVGGMPMDGRDASGLLQPSPGQIQVVQVVIRVGAAAATGAAVAASAPVSVPAGVIAAAAVATAAAAAAAYYWWTKDDAPSDPQTQAQAQGSNGGQSSSQTGSSTNNSDEEQKQNDYDEYKKRCEEDPPPCLTPCELAKWKLQKQIDCVRMMTEWDDKWSPVERRHAVPIGQRTEGIERAKRRVKELCK